ncbi:MAG: DUF1109 family protein [Bdellovibrionales bacterium]|nr:DUF1109 family protein [Bdellovibrionales bacterium]
MDTSELIKHLAADVKPMKHGPTLFARIAGWGVSMVLFGAVTVLIMGTRADIHSVLYTPRFAIESLSILIAGIMAGVLALLLSSPGRRTRRYTVTAFIASGLWLISIVTAFVLQGSTESLLLGMKIGGIVCSQKVIGLAILPALVLTALLRMGSVVAGRLAGALLLVAAGLFGMFALQFGCGSDNTAHLMLYHLLPVAALGILGWHLGTLLCGFESKLKRKKKEILSNR